MGTKEIPLFNFNKYKIPYNSNGLKVNYKSTAKANYKQALLRKKIGDYNGTMLYCRRAIEIDKYFEKSYLLLGNVYLKLRDFEGLVELFILIAINKLEIEILKDSDCLSVYGFYSNEERYELKKLYFV